jgi:3-hydroxyisobutyrate dehydrogenase-like beta-hydroxyacid dehydrogenase
MTAHPERIGFIGLGNMGRPMAGRLAAAGYQVRGFDASPDVMRSLGGSGGSGGLAPAASLAEAGEPGRVILMLPDSAVVERVLLGGDDSGGLLGSLKPGSLVIDMSSSDPLRTRELAGVLAGHDVTLIDAPVSGGVAGAVAGALTIMAGGPEDEVAAIRPVLETMGSRVVRAGDTGAGHAVKALNNLMSAAHLLASSEALIAGRRFGLDPAGDAGDHQRLQRAERLDRAQVAPLRAHRQLRRRVPGPADGQGHQAGPGDRARDRYPERGQRGDRRRVVGRAGRASPRRRPHCDSALGGPGFIARRPG